MCVSKPLTARSLVSDERRHSGPTGEGLAVVTALKPRIICSEALCALSTTINAYTYLRRSRLPLTSDTVKGAVDKSTSDERWNYSPWTPSGKRKQTARSDRAWNCDGGHGSMEGAHSGHRGRRQSVSDLNIRPNK